MNFIHIRKKISTDNRLINLQLLCPNCHAQTDNYSGRSNKVKEKKERYKPVSKIKPIKEQLEQDFKELKSFVQVGKKYNVSDNCVRK